MVVDGIASSHFVHPYYLVKFHVRLDYGVATSFRVIWKERNTGIFQAKRADNIKELWDGVHILPLLWLQPLQSLVFSV